MLKKLALPVVALAVMLILSSAPAQAAVRFGVTVGPSPVYTYPAYPYYSYPYVDPYAYSYPYVAPDYYYAPAPVYTYPSLGFGFGFGGHHGDHDRGRFEHRGNNFHGHENHSRGGFNHGGHRR